MLGEMNRCHTFRGMKAALIEFKPHLEHEADVCQYCDDNLMVLSWRKPSSLKFMKFCTAGYYQNSEKQVLGIKVGTKDMPSFFFWRTVPRYIQRSE